MKPLTMKRRVVESGSVPAVYFSCLVRGLLES